MRKVIGIVGWKDVGKTFVVTEIIKLLVQKGYITQQQLDGVMAVKGDTQIGQVLIQWGQW